MALRPDSYWDKFNPFTKEANAVVYYTGLTVFQSGRVICMDCGAENHAETKTYPICKASFVCILTDQARTFRDENGL